MVNQNRCKILLHIGIVPETKSAAWLEHIGFEDIELKVMESLEKYGYVYIDDTDGYYKANYFWDEDLKQNINLK